MQPPAVFQALSVKERAFVFAYCKSGSAEGAKILAGLNDTTSCQHLLRRADIAAAVRYEITRLLATEGSVIAYGGLKRIAQDQKLPAAAQVAAQKALLQAAGLLDAPQTGKESKAINEMTREELHDYMESKRADINKIEAQLADRARDVTPGSDGQVPDFLE
jgi:hypothetical protein